jgi:hypothetical protein
VGKPFRLTANENKSFQGSIVLGSGFLLQPDEARALIDKNPRNKDVLFPYLNGEDLNSRPDQSPSRWVINFFDWPLDRSSDSRWETATERERKEWLQAGVVPEDYPDPVAADYPECLAIVEDRVRPERELNSDGLARRKWWLHLRPRPELYTTISGMERVLVIALTSRTLAFAFQPSDIVYAHAVGVFATPDAGVFSLLQSTVHCEWARRLASTMKGDTRYTPSDVFETFPFPPSIAGLSAVGDEYLDYRDSICSNTGIGLTDVYKKLHDPSQLTREIRRLRNLQVLMDTAVMSAHGWTDVDLRHDFYAVGSQLNKDGHRLEEVRFSVSHEARTEILVRLMNLNSRCYSEEVKRGLHSDRKQSSSKPKRLNTLKHQTSLSI